MLMQHVLKPLNRRRRRSAKFATGMRIKWNHVYCAANALKQFAELQCCLLGIVDAAEQYILERNPLPPRDGKGTATVDKLLQGIFAIDRHQPAPQLVRRGMQRNGKIHARLFHEPLNLWNESNGGERDPPRRNTQPPAGIAHDVQGAQRLPVIGQRLAHSHENNMSNALAVGQSSARFKDLIEDLTGL